MITPIRESEEGVYKVGSLTEVEDSSDKLDKMLEQPENFRLAFRGSDNSFHEVNSKVQEVIGKNKDLIKKGISIPSLVSEIFKAQELQVKRYLLWKSEDEAFLVGEVLRALKKFSD